MDLNVKPNVDDGADISPLAKKLFKSFAVAFLPHKSFEAAAVSPPPTAQLSLKSELQPSSISHAEPFPHKSNFA